MKLSPPNLYSGLKAKIQKVAQDEYQMKLLSICHKTAVWYVKISLMGLHSLPKKHTNLFAEPASTLEHYRRNVLMYSGGARRGPQGSVMAFSVSGQTKIDSWVCSEMQLSLSAGRHHACRPWSGSGGVIGISSDADGSCTLSTSLNLSWHVRRTWLNILTLSWNLRESVFRNGYRGLFSSLLEEGWGPPCSGTPAPGMGAEGEEPPILLAAGQEGLYR